MSFEITQESVDLHKIYKTLSTNISLNIHRSSIKFIYLESGKQGLSFGIQQSYFGTHLGFQLELVDYLQISQFFLIF